MNKDKNISDVDDYTFDRTYEVNVKGTFYLCKHGIPTLRNNKGGVIINIASFVSLIGSSVSQIGYTASQGAVLAMTRELAVAHAKENIRFIPLCLGHIKTSKMMNMINIPSEKQKRLIHHPMGRFGNINEVAKTIVFLASDDSSYITGNPFIIDGGLTSAYITPE